MGRVKKKVISVSYRYQENQNSRAKPLSPSLDYIRNKLTENMKKCYRSKSNFFCESCGYEKYIFNSCGVRLCPKCYKVRQFKLWKRYAFALNEFKRPKLLTLTTQTTLGLDIQTKKKNDAYARNFFRNLRKRVEVYGIRVLEIKKHFKGEPKIDTKTKKVIGYYEEDCFYSHYHCLVEMPYVSQKILSKMWKKVTKTSCVVDIRETGGEEGIGYVLKYATKPLNFFDLDFYCEVLYKTRMVTKIGKLYNFKCEHKGKGLVCPRCNSMLKYNGTECEFSKEDSIEFIQKCADSYFKRDQHGFDS